LKSGASNLLARQTFRVILCAVAWFAYPAFAQGQDSVSPRIASEPEGAEIFVDGISRGETPASLQLPSGEHDLFIYKKEYAPVRRKVTWNPGERPFIKEMLRKQHGGLVVISDPPGAQVFLNRRPLGLAPLSYENIPQGPYQLEMTLDGFVSYTAEVSIDDIDPNEIRVRLEGPPVKVFVEAEPGALVYLDGSFAGEVTGESLSFPARPGQHELRIEVHGFASVEKIKLQPGQDASVAPGTLRRIPGMQQRETARLSPRWYLVGASAVVTAIGVTVGTLGAVEAHRQRDDYDHAWRRGDIETARTGVEKGNRQFWIGSALAVAGGAGAFFAWPPSNGVTVTADPHSLSLAWRF
jgi:hypothetical protein